MLHLSDPGSPPARLRPASSQLLPSTLTPCKALPGEVRRHNAATVLQQLRLHAPLSRADLAKRIGLNRSTVSSIVTQLLDQGLIRETEFQTEKAGRPGLSLELDPQGGGAIGVEIDPNGVRVILTDMVANLLWRRRIRVTPGESQATYLDCAEALIRQAMQHAQTRHMRLLGMGVTLPGLVDVTQGTLTYSPALRWHDLPLAPRWQQEFHLPLTVENQANAAAMGEYYFGAASHVENFLYLGAGAGMSGGIMIHGELFRGRGGFAGEIGHMTLDPHGPACSCGRRGCWETLVSPQTIVAQYLRRAAITPAQMALAEADDYGLGQVVAAADQGDLAALAAMENMGHYLGIGIANLVNIFNPQLVVLGGLFSLAHETIIPIIKETVKQHSLFPMRTALSVVRSQRGTDDSLLGAVALVLDDLMRAPV